MNEKMPNQEIIQNPEQNKKDPQEGIILKDKITIDSDNMVDVLATIRENNLPLPTFDQLKQEFSKALEDKDEHPWINDEKGPHIHSKELQGKIYVDAQFDGDLTNVDSFMFVPYYSYEWTHFDDIHGAKNFPEIEK